MSAFGTDCILVNYAMFFIVKCLGIDEAGIAKAICTNISGRAKR